MVTTDLIQSPLPSKGGNTNGHVDRDVDMYLYPKLGKGVSEMKSVERSGQFMLFSLIIIPLSLIQVSRSVSHGRSKRSV